MPLNELFQETAALYGIADVILAIEQKYGPISYQIINSNHKAISDSGPYSKDIEEDCSRSPLNGIAAFYLDPQIQERKSSTPIFGLRQNYVHQLNEQNELLVIHELSHAIEKAQLSDHLDIHPSDCDRKIGEVIRRIADKIYEETGGWGNDPDHNEHFGAILSVLIRRRYSVNYAQKLSDSLITNFGFDHSAYFIC